MIVCGYIPSNRAPLLTAPGRRLGSEAEHDHEPYPFPAHPEEHQDKQHPSILRTTVAL